MRQVADLHANGQVAQIALDTVVELDDGQLALAEPVGIAPSANIKAIHEVQPRVNSALGCSDDLII